jgi:hypothetical protein
MASEWKFGWSRTDGREHSAVLCSPSNKAAATEGNENDRKFAKSGWVSGPIFIVPASVLGGSVSDISKDDTTS